MRVRHRHRADGRLQGRDDDAGFDVPAAFEQGFDTAMLVSAALMVAGGLVAAVAISDEQVRTTRRRPERTRHCAVDGPPLEPDVRG